MTIEFNCSNCGKLLKTTDDKAGVRAKCPDCGEPIEVPAPAEDVSDSREEFDFNDDSPESDDDRPGFGIPAPVTAAGNMKACPMCGEQIKAAAVRCRYCGESLVGDQALGSTSYLKPHRAGLILTFAILGWVVCIVFGIVAWVMGNGDLKEMAAGRMDPSGEGMTKAGKIIGMIQVILLCCVLVLYCVIGIIVVIAGGFQ